MKKKKEEKTKKKKAKKTHLGSVSLASVPLSVEWSASP